MCSKSKLDHRTLTLQFEGLRVYFQRIFLRSLDSGPPLEALHSPPTFESTSFLLLLFLHSTTAPSHSSHSSQSSEYFLSLARRRSPALKLDFQIELFPRISFSTNKLSSRWSSYSPAKRIDRLLKQFTTGGYTHVPS